MPVHDWRHVEDGIFHAFHVAWITHLSETLNSGRLPSEYYALPDQGGLAVASPRGTQRTLAIRHTSGHQIVALIEIVSAANKDRPAHVVAFADKITSAIRRDVNALVVDLFPPGLHDPQGMHGAIWLHFDDEPLAASTEEPLTLASYVAESTPTAYVEQLAYGSMLVEMPLFLNPERYVNVPLESTYMLAFKGLPEFWRRAVTQE